MRIVARDIRIKRPLGRALLRRWPFLSACVLLGLLLTGVVLLARPPVYEARSTVRYNPQRYTFPVQARDGRPAVNSFLVQEAGDLLSLRALPKVAQREQAVEFLVAHDGTLVAVGRQPDAGLAQELANQGGEALSDAVRSIYGWNLLRTLLRREIYLQGHDGSEPPSPLTSHLFALLEVGLLIHDPTIDAASLPPSLTAQDVADVTLALQLMEERLTVRIGGLSAERDRAHDPARGAVIEEALASATAQREQVRAALVTLYRQGDSLAAGKDGGAPPEVLPAVRPEQPAGLPRWAFLLPGFGGSLVFGVILALADEAFGLCTQLRELAQYKDLIWNLVLRDLKARYKNSILGYLWSLANPLLLMTVFTVLFKFLLKSSIPNFPVFIIVALLPWNFCASSISGAVTSITGQGGLIKKVYFPREVVPISLVIANLVNFLLALPAMVAIMLALNAHFKAVALLFPLIVLIQTIFLLGMALFLSCLNVFFRDTQVIMDVLLTAWFFLTPIFYRLNDIVDERLSRLVRWFNPMASLVDFYRDILYLGGMPGWDAMVRTFVTALLVLLVGYMFFLRYSPRFGEEI